MTAADQAAQPSCHAAWRLPAGSAGGGGICARPVSRAATASALIREGAPCGGQDELAADRDGARPGLSDGLARVAHINDPDGNAVNLTQPI